MTKTRCCSHCETEKPLTHEYFHKSSKHSSGFRAICIECRKQRHRENQPLTPNRKRRYEREELAIQGLRRCTKCEQIKPLTNEFFYVQSKNTDGWAHDCIECSRLYFNAKSPARYYRAKKLGRINHQIARRSKRKWKQRNPDKVRQAKIKRRLRESNLPNSFSYQHYKHMMEYWYGCCAYCGNQQDFWNVIEADHFIPIANSDCPGTISTNMLPACRNCNASKHSANPQEWLIDRFGKTQTKVILDRIRKYFGQLEN